MIRRVEVILLVWLIVTAGCVAQLNPQDGDSPEITFAERTEESGFKYHDVTSGVGNGNAALYVADINNDGWDDVLALGGERPQLFMNRNGSFDPTNVLPSLNRSFKSAVFVDYDGDGWEDLLLFPVDASAVMLHNRGGQFEHDDHGMINTTYPLGAAPADYDGDGDLDLFVYQSGDWGTGKPEGYFSLNSTVTDDNGNPNLLYENTDSGFERVEDAGMDGDRWSLAASFVDLTGDGRPDIHVSNDYNTDIVYVNMGNGSFSQQKIGGNTTRNGMSSEIADVTGNGQLDVFVSNIYFPVNRQTMSEERYQRVKDFLTFVIHSNRTKGNTLLTNTGDGEFIDRASKWGVRDGGWGWAATFTDFNNDGDRDLLHSTQNVVTIYPDDPVYTYPMLWERNKQGFEQLDASDRGFMEDNGRGMVTLDYDHDGDQDVIMATYGGKYRVYENTVNRSTSLQVRVLTRSGSTAYGATVTFNTGSRKIIRRQRPQTDYLSQESRFIHLGLPDTTTVDLTVTWPDDTEQTFRNVPTERRVVVSPTAIKSIDNLSKERD